MARDFRVIAILSAYNEEDIIAQVVGHLVDQGILVYLLDHWSTDDTVAEVTRYLGRGLLHIERFPADDVGRPEDGAAFSWEGILRRKEVLARELDADWFIHHDADEFRESPWAHLSLREAIRAVDTFGYSAIDFELLDFWPTHDRFRRGDDVREAFPFYEPGQPWDKLQIKCWRNGRPVDLVSTGGHDVLFEGRRVFPLRFILRHYPIRGQAHGERKVLVERRQRFAVERQRGWHRQYDGIEKGHSFLRDPATLISYDPGAVRLQLVLRHRPVEELEGQAADCRRALGECRAQVVGLGEELKGRDGQVGELEAVLEARGRQVAELEAVLEARGRQVAELHGCVGAVTGEIERLHGDLRRLGSELDGVRRLLEAVHASRSWRWTAPLRALQRLLLGS